jgi:protoporphyrinogen/coproporphyrinogen III oxidase
MTSAHPRVVVVGAGVAGLAAAHRLSRHGFDPLVVEAADRIGGRVHTIDVEGYRLDVGAQLLYTDYEATLGLCSELGLRQKVAAFRPTVRIFRRGRLATQLQVLDTWRKKGKIGALYLQLRAGKSLAIGRSHEDSALHRESFEEYVARHYDDDLRHELFEPFTWGLVHDGPAKISAACGLAYVRCAFGRSRAVVGGMASLTAGLARSIRRLNLSCRVDGVVTKHGKVAGLDVSQEGRSQFLPADVVVMAIPAPDAASLLRQGPSALPSFLRGVPYSSSVHVFYALDRPVFPRIYAVVVPRGSAGQIACILEDASKHRSLVPPGAGLAHALIGADDVVRLTKCTDEEIIASTARELRSIVPSFPTTWRFAHVQRWSRSVCLCGPGHVAAVAEFRRRAREVAGLYFAGDFMAVPSVEGAIFSGLTAADEIAQPFGAGTAERIE